ncbi:hypothetical protein [Vibrio cionasavignyae]|uniref:hypothetical protein n=1 Tax=Vibrio cionasavignyae TaxID=2910252 RepID=UPI003D12AADC
MSEQTEEKGKKVAEYNFLSAIPDAQAKAFGIKLRNTARSVKPISATTALNIEMSYGYLKMCGALNTFGAQSSRDFLLFLGC